jgi:hypothetical protein
MVPLRAVSLHHPMMAVGGVGNRVRAVFQRPAGIPDRFDAHVKLMYDLQLLAFQADLTRMITFMYGREQTGRPYPQLGINEPHHQLSHHQNDPGTMEKCARIQTYHVQLFVESGETAGDVRRSLLLSPPP